MRGRIGGMITAHRFSLRNALWAVTWLSLFAGSFYLLVRIDTFTRRWPDVVFTGLLVVLLVAVISTPIMAVSALFGRARPAIILGLSISVLYIGICLTASWLFL
jgi:hypothetical protein